MSSVLRRACLSMKMVLIQPLIILSLFTSIVLTESNGTVTTSAVCVKSEGELAEAIRLEALQTVFPPGQFNRHLDLMFIIDRSNSIGQLEFNQAKELIKELITFLSQRRSILIGNKKTKVSVISFGIQATAEFGDIADEENSIDACLFVDRLNSLDLMNEDTTASEIPAALSRAAEIFELSRNSGSNDVRQVLWLFFDGAEGRQLSYKGRTSTDWASDLRNAGVKIFSVGVGAWMYVDIEREYRVSELATSNDYYACVGTWIKILRQVPEPTPSGDQSSSIYVDIADVYKSRCGLCDEDSECMCDGIEQQYICVDRKQSRTIINPEETGIEIWILSAAISSGVVFLFVILVATLCITLGRRKQTKPHEEPHDGSHSTTISATSIQATTHNSENEEQAAIEEQRDIDYPDMKNYEGMLEDLSYDMPGWSEYLFKEKSNNHLMHLAIRSLDPNRWAKTSGFDIKDEEFQHVYNAIQNCTRKKIKRIRLAKKTYVIDVYQEEISDHHLHAIRRNRRDEKEYAWIAVVDSYIIVGVAKQDQDSDCRDTVFRIYRELEKTKYDSHSRF